MPEVFKVDDPVVSWGHGDIGKVVAVSNQTLDGKQVQFVKVVWNKDPGAVVEYAASKLRRWRDSAYSYIGPKRST